ncbi:hypothetical protein D3C85_1481520 [compost metagenome]
MISCQVKQEKAHPRTNADMSSPVCYSMQLTLRYFAQRISRFICEDPLHGQIAQRYDTDQFVITRYRQAADLS